MQRLIAVLTHKAAANRRAAALWSRFHAGTLRATRGRVGRRWFGAPVLILETVGRRSGQVRHTPVLYLRDGDALVLIAANGGNDRPPSWWLNLREAPTTDVLVGGRRRRMRWRQAAGAERDRLFAAFIAMYPPGGYYTGFTDRDLPLLVLTDDR